MANNKVLLTGAAGFTGRYVSQALQAAGYDIIALSQSPTSDCQFAVDLNDLVSLRRILAITQPTYVIHLAGVAFVGHSGLTDFYNVNLFGTLNLLDAIYAECPKIEKIILASSANVYGNPACSPVSEESCPAPLNHYAMSKLAMEHMARTWKDKLPIIITRPFNYTGSGQSLDFLIPKIVDHFSRKATILSLGNLDVVREFNDVRMVAQAYVQLLKITPDITVNLCSGVGYELNDVLDIANKITKHQIKIEIDSSLVRKNELRNLVGSPLLMQEFLPNLPRHSLADTLGWMFEASTL